MYKASCSPVVPVTFAVALMREVIDSAVAHGDFFAEQPNIPPTLELYDLAADLSESNDLGAKHPGRARELHARLREFGKWQKPGRGL